MMKMNSGGQQMKTKILIKIAAAVIQPPLLKRGNKDYEKYIYKNNSGG